MLGMYQYTCALKCPKRPSFALITVIGVQARDRSEVGPFEIRLVLGYCCYVVVVVVVSSNPNS